MNLNSICHYNGSIIINIVHVVNIPSHTGGGRSLSASSAPSPWQSPSFTPTPTNVYPPSDNVGPDGSPSVIPSDSASTHAVSNDSALYNTVLMVVVIAGALLLVLVMVAVNMLMIVLIKRKRKSKQRIHDVLSQDGTGICSGQRVKCCKSLPFSNYIRLRICILFVLQHSQDHVQNCYR